MLGYGQWQYSLAQKTVRSDMQIALSGLRSQKNFTSTYPPNLAGTGFASSLNTAIKLSTNAPSVGVYSDLSPDQNAQLFLNVCNANMFNLPNSTTCQYQGSGSGAKMHVKGTSGSNAIWNSPVNESSLQISCGNQQYDCEQALAAMSTQFKSQGGSFPIIVSKNPVSLPQPTQRPSGPANRFCLEGRSVAFNNIVYSASSSDFTITQAPCPADPELKYYP